MYGNRIPFFFRTVYHQCFQSREINVTISDTKGDQAQRRGHDHPPTSSQLLPGAGEPARTRAHTCGTVVWTFAAAGTRRSTGRATFTCVPARDAIECVHPRERIRLVSIDEYIVPHKRRPIHHTLKLLIGTRGPEREDIALIRVRVIGRSLPRAQRIAGTLGAVVRVRVDVDSARGDVLPEDGAGEDTVGGFGLVGRGFMAGLEDAREGKVAVLADEAAGVGGVGDDVGVAGSAEGRIARVGNLEGDGFGAEPCGGMSG